MTKTHELKTHPGPFQALMDGTKTFEFRKDDRGFEVGDRLTLREWRPPDMPGAATLGIPVGVYTGRCEDFLITYKLAGRFGVPEGYCVLGIKPESFTVKEGAELRERIQELNDELSDANAKIEELQDLVDAYESPENELPTISTVAVAQLPSLDRDQMLADLKREVLAVGGTWP
jgi:hypothetical protein